jgi:hypothetical protein
MSQTITMNHRRPDARHELDTNAGEIVAPVPGDFARGQRRDIAAAPAHSDFATGMRSVRMMRVTGDFATGMRTSPRTISLGDFATGMRTGAAPIAFDRPTILENALPVAA